MPQARLAAHALLGEKGVVVHSSLELALDARGTVLHTQWQCVPPPSPCSRGRLPSFLNPTWNSLLPIPVIGSIARGDQPLIAACYGTNYWNW